MYLECLNPDEDDIKRKLWTVVDKIVPVQIGDGVHATIKYQSSHIPCECTSKHGTPAKIPEITLFNLPAFRNLIREGMKPGASRLTRVDVAAALSKNHDIPLHCLPVASRLNHCRAQVVKYFIQQKGKQYDFLPKYLTYLAQVNPKVTIALQSNQHNQFHRVFVGFPMSGYHGRLTVPILIADCFHYRSPHYDGVGIIICSKSPFGRTIIHAFGIIPIEDTNSISWFLQMCLKHGLQLSDALFTDQGPLLSAARVMSEKFMIRFNLMLCLQHIFRNMRAKYPLLFPKIAPTLQEQKQQQKHQKSFTVALHNASMADTMDLFFDIIMDLMVDLVSLHPKKVSNVLNVGLYILKYHPTHWTVFANTPYFKRDNYDAKLREVVGDLLSTMLIFEKFDCHVHNDLDRILEFIHQCNVTGAYDAFKWQPKEIYNNERHCPRFNVNKTNMAESMASLMSLCGARYEIPPQSIFYFFNVYNDQVRNLVNDLKVHKKDSLSTIGMHVKYVVTDLTTKSQFLTESYHFRSTIDEIIVDPLILTPSDDDRSETDRSETDFSVMDTNNGDEESEANAALALPVSKTGTKTSIPCLVYPFAWEDNDEIEAASEGLTELSWAGIVGSVDQNYVQPTNVNDEYDLTTESSSESDENDYDSTTTMKIKGSQRRHHIILTESDLVWLKPGQWLNDPLVDLWMLWISRKCNESSVVKFFPTHFYSTLKREGVTVRKNINIFEKKLIFIPINKSLHWSLCVIVNPGSIIPSVEEDEKDRPLPCMLFFDWLQMHQKKWVHTHLAKWLNSEWKRIYNSNEDPFNKNSCKIYDPQGTYCMIHTNCYLFQFNVPF